MDCQDEKQRFQLGEALAQKGYLHPEEDIETPDDPYMSFDTTSKDRKNAYKPTVTHTYEHVEENCETYKNINFSVRPRFNEKTKDSR
jgi:hypothetical protein